MWQSSLNHHLNFWYLENNPRRPRRHPQYPYSHESSSVSLPFSSISLPNLMQITDPGNFFFRQLPYFYTHFFLFLNSEFLKTLAQGRMSLQKATRASLVPWKVQLFQSPLGSLLQTGCSVVWWGPSALRKVSWHKEGCSLLSSNFCSQRNALHISMCQTSNKRLQGTENMKNSLGSEPWRKCLVCVLGCPLLLLLSRGLVTLYSTLVVTQKGQVSSQAAPVTMWGTHLPQDPGAGNREWLHLG